MAAEDADSVRVKEPVAPPRPRRHDAPRASGDDPYAFLSENRRFSWRSSSISDATAARAIAMRSSVDIAVGVSGGVAATGRGAEPDGVTADGVAVPVARASSPASAAGEDDRGGSAGNGEDGDGDGDSRAASSAAPSGVGARRVDNPTASSPAGLGTRVTRRIDAAERSKVRSGFVPSATPELPSANIAGDDENEEEEDANAPPPAAAPGPPADADALVATPTAGVDAVPESGDVVTVLASAVETTGDFRHRNRQSTSPGAPSSSMVATKVSGPANATPTTSPA